MGYQALLFCPDEKIARTVTQVLSELEFAVESCVEPFAAVKKLMAEHFDAVVVDCDNDQNASLLFKSARNSAINQASLAVAVVEGQAGVAKAFRIGANLVLTKPINVEQAKGTLRVARGLLRKGDAAKPSAPVATTPVPPKPASAVPAAPARPATLAAATAVKPRPVAPPISKPAASVPAKPLIQTTVAAAASSANPASAKAATETAGAQQAVKSGLPADSAIKPPATLNPASASSQSGSGAASAPAPAREVVAPASEAAAPGESKSTASPDKTYSEKIAVESVAAEKPADAISADTIPSASTPAESAASTSTFTFGGANLPEKSENAGSKKIFLGIAAVVFLVCAIYFGWTQLHDSVPAAAPTQTSSAPTKAPAPAQPASVRPSGASATASSPGMQTSLPQSQAANSGPSTSGAASDDSDSDGADAPSANSKPSASSTATKSVAKTATVPATKTAPASDSATPANAQPAAPETAAPAIILKNGSTKSTAKLPASDTAAPSMVGLAAAGSDGNLSNLTAGDSVAKPILQTLTVSQGVSQGLLLKKVQPAYPANALRMRTEGVVKLMATVGKTGSVTTVKVVSGDALLTQSALDAVKQWKYKPYLLNGSPIEIQTEVTINFKLPH
jgi:periplasmic protein TonB